MIKHDINNLFLTYFYKMYLTKVETTTDLTTSVDTHTLKVIIEDILSEIKRDPFCMNFKNSCKDLEIVYKDYGCESKFFESSCKTFLKYVFDILSIRQYFEKIHYKHKNLSNKCTSLYNNYSPSSINNWIIYSYIFFYINRSVLPQVLTNSY